MYTNTGISIIRTIIINTKWTSTTTKCKNLNYNYSKIIQIANNKKNKSAVGSSYF